jgi:hypothetical protein
MASTSVLIAYDGSGSTGGCAVYHDTTQTIVRQYPEAKILFWDNSHKVITAARLAEINTAREGFGGTSPVEIAKWVRANNFHGHLIIITDGEVHISGVDDCSSTLGDWSFEYVNAHLIGGSVNMSITCPFTRSSSHTVYLYEPSSEHRATMTTRVDAKDMELLTEIDHISTVEQFQAIAEKLETVLVARTMGTNGNMELRDRLLGMKKRMNSTIAAEAGESDAAKDYVMAVTAHNYDAAAAAAKRLTAEYYVLFGETDVSGSTWSSKVNRMIAMTEGALRGVFSMNNITAGIQSDRVRRAAGAAPAAAPAPASVSAQTESKFVCPITLDAENDVVLLVKAGDPILAGLDKHIVDDLLDCPLNLTKYPDLIEKLADRLDHPMSLAAFSANASGWNHSPMTRDPVLAGAICFGAADDHIKATQWTLVQLFTGGKLAGNPDFWYACIWWVLRHNCPVYLEAMKSFADAHMLWRLQQQKSFIALSGLPEFPTTRVPLNTAIWYVLASPLFGDEFGAGRDVLRGHLPHLAPLLELVDLAGFDIPVQLKRHYTRLRTMLRYLAWIKADRVTLPMYSRMLIQAHLAVNPLDISPTNTSTFPKYVPVDGPPSASQILEAREHLRADPMLTIDELVGIAGMVSPQKSAGDIPLPLDWNPTPTTHVVEWMYGLGEQEPINLNMNPKTCRPQYQYGEETWRDIATRKFGPVEKQISVCAYYGKFVETYGAYPSRNDMLVHIYKRCVVYGKHSTLPAAILQFIEEVCRDYAPISATVSSTEFIRRWRESVRVEDRKRIE